MTIYLGADHRGFSQKQFVSNELQKKGLEIVDCGDFQENGQDDFVDFAKQVSEKVVLQDDARGVLFCGSGVGMSIAANKINGVRAGLGFSREQVKAGREDDDMNILVIASDFFDQTQVNEMIEVFLETSFANEERFLRRLKKIQELES